MAPRKANKCKAAYSTPGKRPNFRNERKLNKRSFERSKIRSKSGKRNKSLQHMPLVADPSQESLLRRPQPCPHPRSKPQDKKKALILVMVALDPSKDALVQAEAVKETQKTCFGFDPSLWNAVEAQSNEKVSGCRNRSDTSGNEQSSSPTRPMSLE